MSKTDFNDMGDHAAIRQRVNAAISPRATAAPNLTPECSDPPPWPELAPEALMGFAGEVVTAATANSEADPVAVLATMLTHAGIFAGRGPRVRVGDDFHHARLFTALVGQSARGRKGTSEKPVRRINAVVADRLGPLAWVPGPLSTGEGLAYAIRDGDGEEGGDAGVSDKRFFVVEGEFGAALRAMQRQGNTLSTALRSAWDGSTIAPMTKGNRISATDPHVGIVAHITQAELRELLSRVDLFNGFANRFLWLCVRRQKLLPLASGMAEADVQRLGTEYADRLAAARKMGEVVFSDEARRLYVDLYEEIGAERSGPHGLVTTRAEAQAVRLALTYAVLDASPVITSDHLTAALAIVDYCDASALYLFGTGEAGGLDRRLLDLLKSGPATTTDLNKALSGHTSSDALQAALAGLEARGRIERQTERTTGRPRVLWRLRSACAPAEKAEYPN